MSGVLLYHSLPCSLELVFLTEPWSQLETSKPHKSPYLCPLDLGLQMHIQPYLAFHMDARNLNSGPPSYLCHGHSSVLSHLLSLFGFLFSTKVFCFLYENGDFLAPLLVPLGYSNPQGLQICDPRWLSLILKLLWFIGATCWVPLFNGTYWADWVVRFLVP